jgi:hypothetical protein
MDERTSLSEDAWKAFEYEVWMFYETRTHLSLSSVDPIVHNALVESSLLHTRILVGALLSRGEEPDNVDLNRLLSGSPASDGLTGALATLDSAYGTRHKEDSPCWILNKRLAHLTNVRGDSFDYRQVFTALDPLVLAALREVALVAKRPLLSQYAGLKQV